MQLTLIKPDDWHTHLRDGVYLSRTVPDLTRSFHRAIIMPNLDPPIDSIDAATAYRKRIIAQIPKGQQFEPLMTFYLTSNLSPALITSGYNTKLITAVKYYPRGVTTNSQAGLSSLKRVMPILETMAKIDMPLLIHGEVPEKDTDIFDREEKFLDSILSPLIEILPELRIVLEHITTLQAVQFVKNHDQLGATITPHHLMYDRNDLLANGLSPHLYCAPILKRSEDRKALISAATSGNSQFFLGTDSAPHSIKQKESSCGCAGCYTAPYAVSMYADIFEKAQALDQLEAFTSKNGPLFYGKPINKNFITLRKVDFKVPSLLRFGKDWVRPLKASEQLPWSLI